MRTGILGGTFDPVHRSHILLARAAMRSLGLDRVLMLPSGEPPYKKPVAGKADRLRMLQLAVEGEPGLEVCDIEIRRDGPTYAVDTLRELKSCWPDDEFVYILGSDAAAKVGHWKDIDEIRRLCSFACVSRSGCEAGIPDDMTFFTADIPDVSSSAVRSAVARGGREEADIPAKTLEYIAERGLYIAEMPIEDIVADLKQRLKPGRFAHTLGVAQTARELAVRNGMPGGRGYIAGLLHDCAKGLSPDELAELADISGADAEEKAVMPVLHAPVGAYLARERYGVRDEGVLSAIRRHTIGAEDMSLLDAVIYVADMVEPGRKEFPGLAGARALAERDVFAAAALCGRLTREFNRSKGQTLHSMTEKMINSIETGGMNNG